MNTRRPVNSIVMRNIPNDLESKGKVKSRLIQTIAVFSALVLSAVASQSPNVQDHEKALDFALIAPTDWDSLKNLEVSDDDCDAEKRSESCDGGLPKPKTTAEARGMMISDECNGKTKVLAAYKPCYPAIAKSANASRAVDVMVVVDESGKVTWAHGYRGHPLLQFAAVRAACRWRFEPARCGRVNRMITFNFVEAK
jgi:TonB family protein